MKVKELIEELKCLPPESEAFFSIWMSDGRKSFWFNKTYGEKIFKDKSGKVYSEIAFTDYCKMYSIDSNSLEIIKEK